VRAIDFQAKVTKHSLPPWHVWDTMFDKLDELSQHNTILGIFFAVVLAVTVAGATSVVTVLLVKLLAYLPPWENSQATFSQVFQLMLFGIAFTTCLMYLRICRETDRSPCSLQLEQTASTKKV
jgi:hypothetical protein